MADKIKATVTVVPREGFPGFWSAQRFFENGSHVVELTPEDKKLIETDAALGLPIAVGPAPEEKSQKSKT
jgi:hypothetical protein